MSLKESVRNAIEFAEQNNIVVPAELLVRASRVDAYKGISTFRDGSSEYEDALIAALTDYFKGANYNTSKSEFVNSMLNAFESAFYSGWKDGKGGDPIDADALAWYNARLDAERGYINLLFQQASALKREDDFDWEEWVQQRGSGYSGTLRDVYNNARLRAMEDIMVTFTGKDGKESCVDCKKYHGKRHKISWFVARDAVPPYGLGLECHAGGKCKHKLVKDNGRRVTV